MKKVVTLLSLTLILGLVIGCPNDTPVPTVGVTSVRLNETSLNLAMDESALLTPTITPDNATNKDVTWTSSDETVATVANGVVSLTSSATSGESAIITVTTDDGGFTATCVVTVTDTTIPVTGISLNHTNLAFLVDANKTQTLSATITPANATNKGVTWESSDETVATVANGVVSLTSSAILGESAIITVTTDDGGFAATCSITVTDIEVPVTNVSLNHTSLNLNVGDSTFLTPIISPDSATNKEVIWTSSDESVATVVNGVVSLTSSATSGESASITVTTVDGDFTATCVVTVTDTTVPVTGISLNPINLTFLVDTNETQTLNATITPTNATNKGVTWTSSDESVATVANGVVSLASDAVKGDTATISAITLDGSFTATCSVMVTDTIIHVTSVMLNPLATSIVVGESETIKTYVYPSEATNKAVTWTSNDTSIATVDEKGTVTAVREGQTSIRVTTADGNKTNNCIVTVIPTDSEYVPVDSLGSLTSSYYVIVGREWTPYVYVAPLNATNKGITWESSDNTIVTVDEENGNASAVGEGVATITAASVENPSITTTFRVTVVTSGTFMKAELNGPILTVFPSPDGKPLIKAVDSVINNSNIQTITKIIIKEPEDGTKIIAGSDLSGLFSNYYADAFDGEGSYSDDFTYTKLTEIEGLEHIDTSNVTNMSHMFAGCSALDNLNVSTFDTSNVEDMSGMFRDCKGLTSLDVSGFNTTKVTDMESMFHACTTLPSLNVRNFNTENVENMSGMFYYCRGLTSIDVRNFNTENVTDMSYMFAWCGSLTSLDVRSFNTTKVTDMESMFHACTTLPSLNVRNFNTENVTNMYNMFTSCKSLTSLDLSDWNTQNVTNMIQMFYWCESLTSLNLSNWNTQNVTATSVSYPATTDGSLSMFSRCSALTLNGVITTGANLGSPSNVQEKIDYYLSL